MNPRSSTPRPAMVIAAFAIVYTVWGSTYLAIRFAVETLPPFTMAGMRFLIAGLIFYPIVRSRTPDRPTPRQWLAAAAVGCLMLIGGNGLVCWAEQHVDSGIAALMVGTVPLWMTVLDWLVFRGPRPSRFVALGLAAGITGIAILIGPGRIGGAPIHAGGCVALLAACVFWSFGSLLSRRVDSPSSTLLGTAMTMITAGAALFLVAGFTGEYARIDFSSVTLKSWLALAYLIVFGAILGFTSYVWLLKVCTPSRVATYAFVNPMIAVLLGATLGDEIVSARTGAAAAIIVLAVVLITMRPAMRAPRHDDNTESEELPPIQVIGNDSCAAKC